MLNRCLHTGICTDPTQMTLELLPLLKAGSGTVEGGGRCDSNWNGWTAWHFLPMGQGIGLATDLEILLSKQIFKAK